MSRKERKQKQRTSAKAQKSGKAVKAEPVSSPENRDALVIEPGFWKRNWLAALVLFALPFMLYAATLNFGYVLDDQIVLSENDFVREGISGMGDIFGKETFTGFLGEQKDLVAGGRYRPLSLAAFAVEYQLFGDDPGLFHLFNIIWYAFVGLIIFRVLGILFPGTDRQWYMTVPFIATLLFMAHPIHTEAVANIKGRDEIMTFALAMATLYLSLKYIARPNPVYLAASAVVFLLALLAKENAITFLAVIPLTIWCFTNATIRRNAKALAPLLIATAVYLVIRSQVLGYLFDSGKEVTGLMNNPFRDMTSGEKYATIFYTLWRYIQLLFFPHPLTHDYYPYQIPKIGWSDIRSIGPLLLYIGLAAYALIGLRKKRNVPAYAILFFIATISITSNMVFSVGTFMNERFAFMPSLGFTLLLAYWLVDYLPRKLPPGQQAKLIGLAVAALLSAGYSYKTLDRVPDWKDPMTLNLAAVKVSKNSARIHNFMGFDYYKLAMAETDREKKRYYLDEATKYMDRALEIHPTYPDALKGKAGLLGGYHQLDGDLQKLLDGFYRILSVRHIPYIDEYLEYLNRRGPNARMTNFYHHTGYTLFLVQKRDNAMAKRYLDYGLSLDPNSALLNQDMGMLYFQMGRKQEAAAYFRKALQLDPTLEDARRYLELSLQ